MELKDTPPKSVPADPEVASQLTAPQIEAILQENVDRLFAIFSKMSQDVFDDVLRTGKIPKGYSSGLESFGDEEICIEYVKILAQAYDYDRTTIVAISEFHLGFNDLKGIIAQKIVEATAKKV